MKREEKEAAVAELRDALTTAPSLVLTASGGMPVNKVNALRSKLRAVGGRYKVVKNTLAKRAIEGSPAEVISDLLAGPTAVAWHPDDAVVVAKVLTDYKKDNQSFEIKAGYLNGALLDASGVEQLSKMPGKDELRAKLLNVFTAAGTSFVRVLNAGPQKFLNVLNARKDSLN